MIKPVDEIPMNITEQRKSYRTSVRNDIYEAIDKGILKFEFVGDYNFSTLQATAREEAESIIIERIRKWLNENPQYKQYVSYVYSKYYKFNKIKHAIRITSTKGTTPKERRVFCEINPDMEKPFKEFTEEEILNKNHV